MSGYQLSGKPGSTDPPSDHARSEIDWPGCTIAWEKKKARGIEVIAGG